MIPSKIFSIVAFFGAVLLSSTSATSLPSQPICYRCPLEISDKDVPFDIVDEDRSLGVLECFYENKKKTEEQTFCSYKLNNGLIVTNGDGFCAKKAKEENGSQCEATQ